MKKKRDFNGLMPGMHQTFLKMKLTIFILVVSVMGAFASHGYSQNSRFTLKLQNVSIENFLRSIEDQSGYRFFYSGKIDVNKKISVDFENESIAEVLDRALNGTEIRYEITGRQIILSSNIINHAAQRVQTISGKVIDTSGGPLPGVTVIVKGTSNGTTTDGDGKFEIANVPSDATLIFSFVGMKSQEIILTGETVINVTMVEESIGLEEVVAIGYGVTRKSDLTGAIASVSAEDFEKQPVLRVEEALQGRAAGVQVLKNSGAPGSDIKIRIRGSNSINGDNQPLVVVDGVIGAELRSINTNDIASMEVLKDASATAIYGSRGANGVILISTKRGSEKPVINLDVFGAISSVTKKIDLLSAEEFGAINNLPVIDGGTDYQEEYFKSGYTKNVQLSLSGRKNDIGYFISGNLIDQSGTAINSNYRRYSLRSNLDAKLTNKLSIQLNLYGSNEKMLNLVRGGISSSPDDRGGIVGLLGWDPTLPIKDESGNYNLLSSNGSGLINPIAQRLESEDNSNVNALNASVNISYDITDNLKLSVIGGLLHQNTLSESYFGIPAGTVIGNPTGSGASGYVTTLQNSNILTWEQMFEAHSLKLTGLFEIQKFINKSMVTNSGEYSIPSNYYNIELGTTPTVQADLSESQIASWMGRAEYNFDKKLYLTGAVRADVSSKFRPGNQLGVFPSGTVAYQIRDLIAGNIDRLKIRAGYGETGNQGVAPYITYNTLTTGQNYPLNGVNEVRGITTPENVANPDLTWETTKQSNIGMDITIFEGRTNIEINKYWKNTSDLLLDVPIPFYLGGGSVTRNVGEVFNGGWEFNVQMSLVNSEKISWQLNTNYSYNRSEVLKLTDEQEELILNPLPGIISNTAGAYVLLREGDPMGQFYGASFLGTYKTGDTEGTPGHARYLKDAGGNIVLGIIGNGTPKHTWSINNTLTLGAFDLNFLLRGVHGFEVMNFTRAKIAMAGGVQSLPTLGEFRERWTFENETDIPAGGDLYINSTRFVEKGDFVRLSNLAIGYNVKANKLFQSLRFYISAQNLFTITKYSGYDPEASSIDASVGSSSSIDYGANPNSRTFTLGLNVNF